MRHFRAISYSFLGLIRDPISTVAVTAVVALALAASTTIFTLVDELLLNPFPYQAPANLAVIWEANPARGALAGKRATVAWENFDAWRIESHSFEALEAHDIFLSYNLTGFNTPEHLLAARATAGFFPMLGVNAISGRTFLPEDAVPNANPTVIATYTFALKHFGDKNPIGQRILLDDIPYTIIGVLPRNFHLPAFFEGLNEYKPDLWLPLPRPSATDSLKRRSLVVWARLKSNISLAQARADMAAVAQRRQQEDPDLNQGYSINIFPLATENTDPDFRNDLRVFSLAAFIVLMLAASNAASLMLLRHARQKKDIAIMWALGAGRLALIEPLLAQALLLALISTAVAVLCSYLGVHLVVILKPSDIHAPERLAINLHAFIFTCLSSLLTLVLFGFIPAWITAKSDLTSALKSTPALRITSSYSRTLLIACQIGIALALTIVATLLGRSFQNLLTLDPGFNPQHLLTAHLTLSPKRYNKPEDRHRFTQELRDKLQLLSGVESVAFIDYMPMYAVRLTPFEIEGQSISKRNGAPYADFAHISPAFFQSMGIGLIQGKLFSDQDADSDPPNTVIINQALSRQHWPNQSPVGSHVRQLPATGPPGPWQVIIGVVNDVRQINPETPPRPELFWPASAFSEMTVILRTPAREPSDLGFELKQAVWSIDHDQPLADIQTVEQLVGDINTQRRFNMLSVGTFAAFAVLLALVGLYALVSTFISSHTRDIGIRLALGAKRTQVCFSLLRQIVVPVSAGIVLGLLLTFLARKLIASVVFQISPLDHATYIGASVSFLLICVLTAITATIRAARIDPAEVLRSE